MTDVRSLLHPFVIVIVIYLALLKGEEDKENCGKEKKKKNPEDKKDPAKLKMKLEKIDAKMQALALKREDIVKLMHQVEQGAANPTGGACTTITS